MNIESESSATIRNTTQAFIEEEAALPGSQGPESLDSHNQENSFDVCPEDIDIAEIGERSFSLGTIQIEQSLKAPAEPFKLDSLKLASSYPIKIRDIDVMFPFKPYEAQIAYMTSVIDSLQGKQNALLQSPTGTGKTLCLLCATLAWLNHYRTYYINNPSERVNYKPVKIYYSTRTHSQIKQVIRELKKTCYRPATALLGSRDQLCIKSDFIGLQRFQMNAACKAARITRVPEQRCTYSDSYSRSRNSFINKMKENLYDIEELADAGRSQRFCPYLLESDMTDHADLVLLPYNYLLDGRVRGGKLALTDAVLVFDEAHNLERVIEDGSSFSVSTKDMENCELDIKLLKQKFKKTESCKLSEEEIEMLEYPIDCLSKNLERMKKENEKEFKNRRRWGNNSDSVQKSHVEEGRKIFEFFKQMTQNDSVQCSSENPFKNGIDAANFQAFMNLLSKAIEDLSDVPPTKGGLDNIAFCAMIIYDLLKIDGEASAKTLPWAKNHINSYMFHTDFEFDEAPEFSFSLSCLHPGIGFTFVLKQGPRNIILTSGTLAPLKSFETELTTEFPVQLLNSHVIDTKTQCSTLVVTRGPTGQPLNFSYENKDKIEIYKEMGDTLISIAKLVKNGILVCFASYALMDRCFGIWEQEGQLEKIESLKKIYKEPRKQNRLDAIMQKYLDDAKTKGAILCCVCRGKISEGIDFADEMARAVVLIGVPYPYLGDIKVDYKKKFLDKHQSHTKRVSGKEWYMQQTLRAVNQAIGRVIRHIKDYGMVFLCDERYAGNQIRKELSSWITDNLQVIDKFGFMIGKIGGFFRDKNQSSALNQLCSQDPVSFRENIYSQNSFARTENRIINQETTNANPFNFHFSLSQNTNLPSTDRLLPPRVLIGNNEILPPRNDDSIKESEQFNFRLERQFRMVNKTSEETNRDNAESSENNQLSQVGKKGTKKVKTNNDNSGTRSTQKSPNTGKSRWDGGFSQTTLDLFSKSPSRAKNESECQSQSAQCSAKQEKNEFKISNEANEKGEFGCILCLKNKKVANILISKCGHFACEDCWNEKLSVRLECPLCNQKTRKKFLTPITAKKDLKVNEKYQNDENENSLKLDEDNAPGSKGQRNYRSEDEKSNKENINSENSLNRTKNNQCIICFDNTDNKIVKISECGHIACGNCWENWLKVKQTCPSCEKTISKSQLSPGVLASSLSRGENMKNVEVIDIELQGVVNKEDVSKTLWKNINSMVEPPPNLMPKKGLDCIICMDNGEEKVMMVEKCGHVACETCWKTWLERKSECPICKKTIKKRYLIKLHI